MLLHLCFAWNSGSISSSHTAYKLVQICEFHISCCMKEGQGLLCSPTPVQQFPFCKKISSRGKTKSSDVSILHTLRKTNLGKGLISVSSVFLSLSISIWLTLQLPWHPWDWGQNGMNQKILATCIMGSLSSHFLLNSAEPEHARQLGSKWEGNC